MENTLKEVFDLFADQTEQKSIKREDVFLMLQSMGCIVLGEDVEKALPTGKESFTFSEIEEMVSQNSFLVMSKEDVVKAFEVFDTQKTGKMSVSTLKAILQEGENSLSQEEIDACLEILNPTPEGVIEYLKNRSLVQN